MISVIIPCYNYGHLIGDTLLSLVNQTHTDWEAIIVDDGSADNTAEVVADFVAKDKRICFHQQSNAGPSAARNKALAIAKGDFIQFLDADDLLERQKFEIQTHLFADNPTADVVYGTVRYFTGNPANSEEWKYTYWGENKEWMPKIAGKGIELLPAALKGSFGHISSFLFSKAIVDKAGLWDANKRAAEDYLFVLRCVLAGGYFFYHDTPGSYALVRWHDNNASRNVSWIHDEERKMRIELATVIEATGNKEAVEVNSNAIKALSFMTKQTWRSKLLSGGPFDFVKKGLRFIGLEKLARKIFYK
jgi:glycosyltransferase involved in cell wall biosynthesis